MFKQIKYIFLLLFLVSTHIALAQRDTTLTQEVEVTKAYKPTLSDANKINEMPKIDNTEHQVPSFNYTIYSNPILNTFSVNPLKAATSENTEKKETGYGLVRGGAGNYNRLYGEVFYNNLNSKKSIFGVHARHLSSNGRIKLDGGDKVDALFSKNVAEVYYKYNFGKSILSVDVDYSHDGFNYYGYPEVAIPTVLLEENQDLTYQGSKQTFSKGGISIDLKNPTVEIDEPVFNYKLNYHSFGTKTDQREHFGEFEMDFQKPFDSGTLLADVGITYVQADGVYIDSLNEVGKRQQTWLFAKPSYFFEGKMADIQIGFDAWFVMDPDMEELVKLAPNIHVNFVPVKDKVKFYVGLDGNYINNHYSKVAYENPFVDPMHDVKNSFEKLHFYAGVKGKFSAQTSFKIGLDYSMIDGQPFYYLNEYVDTADTISSNPLIVNNAFDVLYDNINLLKFNVEVFHTSLDKLDLSLSGNYYAYNLDEQEEAWNMPGWDATFSLDYKITEQLSVGTDIYLIGQRKALIIEEVAPGFSLNNLPVYKSFNLDTAIDLNVNATYQITHKFAAFGQLNNFGFQKYQRWLGYTVQSFNALVGVSYAF